MSARFIVFVIIFAFVFAYLTRWIYLLIYKHGKRENRLYEKQLRKIQDEDVIHQQEMNKDIEEYMTKQEKKKKTKKRKETRITNKKTKKTKK